MKSRNARRSPGSSVSGCIGHPLQRRADSRLPARDGAPERHPDEPAILRRAACEGQQRRNGSSSSALGAPSPCTCGRLVAITSDSLSPGNAAYREAFAELRHRPHRVHCADRGCSLPPPRHTIDTRLTIIDRMPAENTAAQVPCHPMAESAPALLDLVTRHVPARPACEDMPSAPAAQPSPSPRPVRPLRTRERGPLPPARPSQDAPAIELAYTVDARADEPRRLLSATRSMSPTASRPSVSTAPSPIRPGSSSPRPWHPSRRRGPPTGRTCPPASSPKASSPTPSSKASSTRARPTPAPRRPVESQRDPRRRRRRARRRHGRRALPARLVPR